jgi:HD-like signal output (HDOD) protein
VATSAQPITRELLSRFPTLRHLGPEALGEIRRQGTFGELPGGRRLFAAPDATRWAYFLAEGRVEVVYGPGAREVVAAGDAVAREPLGRSGPEHASARSLTTVRYLRVAHDILEVLRPAHPEAGYEVEELHQGDDLAENRLYFRIYEDYLEDRLEVPELPELGLRVRRAVEDPRVGSAEIARMVQADPALAARLIRVANSALYGGVTPVRNLREAVVRLGLAVTRDLVVSFTLKNLFQSEHRALHQRILELWRRSSMVAAICFTIARITRCCEPEQALLAGLVHDLGAAALLREAASHPELLDDPARLDALLERLRGEVGGLVLERWAFGPELVRVAREARHWQRDPRPEPDLCDVVVVAQLHGFAEDDALDGLPAPDATPACRKLGLDELTTRQRIRILDDAKEEIAELRRLLAG